MGFWTGLLIGAFGGATFGVFVMAAIQINHQNEKAPRAWRKGQKSGRLV
jgi:hypothetical protein